MNDQIKKKNLRHLCVRIDPDLYDQLKKMSENDFRSFSQFVHKILRNYVQTSTDFGYKNGYKELSD